MTNVTFTRRFRKILLPFVLAIVCMSSCSEKKAPVLELNSQDKQVIETLAKDVPARIGIGQEIDVIDSVLMSYGFTKFKGQYYLNAPSEEYLLWLGRYKGYTLSDSIANEQFAEIMRKGHAFCHITIETTRNKCQYFMLSIQMLHSLRNIRSYYLLFSNNMFDCYAKGDDDFWDAEIWNNRLLYSGKEDFYWDDKNLRSEFIEKFSQNDAMSYGEHFYFQSRILGNIEGYFPLTEENNLTTTIGIGCKGLIEDDDD